MVFCRLDTSIPLAGIKDTSNFQVCGKKNVVSTFNTKTIPLVGQARLLTRNNQLRFRECVSMGAAGARTRRSLGDHLLHPLILRLLVLCAPAVLKPRALQDVPGPADPNS